MLNRYKPNKHGLTPEEPAIHMFNSESLIQYTFYYMEQFNVPYVCSSTPRGAADLFCDFSACLKMTYLAHQALTDTP